MKKIKKLIASQGVTKTLLVIWACALMTYATINTFGAPITAEMVGVFTGVVSVFIAVLGKINK